MGTVLASIAILAFVATWPLPASRLRDGLPAVKDLLAGFFEWLGDLGFFFGRVVKAMVRPPFEFRELMRQCDSVGAKSMPLVALAGAATGVVMSLQMRDAMVRFGARSLLPAVIVYSIIKETGPVITGLIVSGRVGAGIGAELGSMKVTDQIDAMEASAVDPYRFLAATRIMACVLMLPLLTLVADFFGIFMGWAASTFADAVSLRYFVDNGFKTVLFTD